MFFPGDAIGVIEASRAVWITGWFGSFKTTLAVAIADYLLSRHRNLRCYTNLKSLVFADPVTPPIRNCILLLDEGGVFLNNTDSHFLVGLRKLNVYLIVSSVYPVPSWLQFFIISSYLDFTKLFLPCVLYAAEFRSRAFKDRVRFLFFPKRYLGLFDTREIPTDDANISMYYKETVNTVIRGSTGGITNIEEQVEEQVEQAFASRQRGKFRVF